MAADATAEKKGGTAAWGPPLWQSIHFVAMCYPGPKKAKAYQAFYTSLQHVLPCKVCAKHYSDELRRMPLADHLDSREQLFAWTVELHNRVNLRLGKPTWEVERALEHYTKMIAPALFAAEGKADGGAQGRGDGGAEGKTRGRGVSPRSTKPTMSAPHVILASSALVALVATSLVLYLTMRRPRRKI